MGLSANKIEESKNGLKKSIESHGMFNDSFSDNSKGNRSETESLKNGFSSSMKKEVDWEERHFQICLALISRADLTSYHNNTVSTKELSPAKIIKQADNMVEALKKHYL